MLNALVQTKFYIPPLRPNLVARPHLLERLNAGLGSGRPFPHRLTLISAPAGFGKTTLTTNWLCELESANPTIVCGWLSLDETDDELHRFLTYLVAAVQKAELGNGTIIGADLLAGLQSARPLDEGIILPALLNELAAIEQPLLLVLDDYHLITQAAIHDWLAQLIDHLPPQVHFVITSREDPLLPLARWRVRGQLTEIRSADLRFSQGEAADFLHHTMGLSLADEIVTKLENRTEGWVAGLQLAALSMQGAADVAQLVADFSGSDRHVAGYLLEEVLHRQPPFQQQFLLETAVLERFNAAVCDHLTGRRDSRELLETLHQNNLFIIPLDNQGEWYRYHHLFAQLLRHRLTRDESAEKRANRHRLARDWFESQGLVDETLYHALKAGDVTWAADYLCRFSPSSLWEGTKATRFKSWIAQLPPATITASPRLMLLSLWAFLITADVKLVEDYLERLLEMTDLEADLQAELFLIRAVLVRGKGDNETALEFISRALKVLPEDQEFIRMVAFTQVISASLNLGQTDRAHDVARFIYDSVNTHTMAGLSLFLTAAQLLSITMRDRIQFFQAMNLLQQSIEVVQKQTGDFLPLVGLIFSELARIYYEWNELEKAADYCQQTIELGERSGITDLLFPSYLLDAQLARHEGELKRLGERLKWFKEITHRSDMTELVTVADYLEASFRLEVGDVTSAVRWAEASGLHLDDKPTFPRYGHYFTLARIYLAESQHHPQDQAILLKQVSQMIERLTAVIKQVNNKYGQVEILILKAILLKLQGQPDEAAVVMAQAVVQAEAGSLVRVFLDSGPAVYSLIHGVVQSELPFSAETAAYTQRLLQACEAEWGALPSEQLANPLISPLIDPLTEREHDVLTCLAAGLTNREIEERLVISRNTVRTHLKNLYSKLGTNGRADAVEQGRL
ncbi:MAG: LuxR C-terminal-related transcriptional regulator, partial [Candidatus Promineifilaceae bacterium]